MEEQKKRFHNAKECIKHNYVQREKALVNQLFMQQTLHGGQLGM